MASPASISNKVSKSISRFKYKSEYESKSILKSKLIFKRGAIGYG